MSKISVIIPVYNASKFLAQCLLSVINQTYCDLEIIVVDDGSTDASMSIIKQYAKKDKRIKIISKENGGVSSARNVGIKAATGKYLLFVDSDDVLHLQTAEITHAIAEKSDVDIVSYRYIKNNLESFEKNYDLNGIKFKKTDNLLAYATEKTHSLGRWKIRRCYPVLYLYRRGFIKNMKFDETISISEDFPWWTQILLKRPVCALTRLRLYYYRPNADSALLTVSPLKFIQNVTSAIMVAYKSVRKSAGPDDTKIWRKEFMWPFIIMSFRKVKNLGTVDINFIKSKFRQLYKTGALDNPTTWRTKKYRQRVLKFIEE